jgi:hypothetical protein
MKINVMRRRYTVIQRQIELRLGKCTKMSGNILLSDAAGLPCAIPSNGDSMKSSTLYAGAVLACALGLSACGGGSGDLPLTVQVLGGVTKEGLVLRNEGNGDEIAVPAGATGVTFAKYLSTDDEFNIVAKTLPSNVSGCQFSNNKARANYYTVYTTQPKVFCTIVTHDLGVKVTGLTSANLVLVNGADRQAVTPNGGADVTVAMAKVPEDGPYGVTILTQPDNQTCAISGGTGTMNASGPSTTPVVACGPKTQ